MTILLSLLSNYWKQILLVILIGTICILGYNHIYNNGYNDSNKEWEKKELERNKKIDEQIQVIEGYAKTNLEQTLINHVEVSKDLKSIYVNSKKKPLTNVDCNPTTNFVDTFNNTIDRGNKK